MGQFSLVGPVNRQRILAHIGADAVVPGDSGKGLSAVIGAALFIGGGGGIESRGKTDGHEIVRGDLVPAIKPHRFEFFDKDLGGALIFPNDL